MEGVQYIMNNDEMLARLGISSRLAYGLLFQSILVIWVAIISIWGIFEIKQGFTLSYITNILSLLVSIFPFSLFFLWF